MSVEIFTDSTADLPPDIVKRLDIHVVPLEVRINGNLYQDGMSIKPNTVIKHMNDGVMPETSAPSPGLFKKMFEEAYGNPIVCVDISSELSGTYQSARIGGDGIRPAPYIIDSSTTSMALGFLAMHAAQMKFDGLSANHIQENVEELKKRAVAIFTLFDPKWAAKDGRISEATALAAKILKIKPIMMMFEGKAVEVERIRIWEKAKSRLEVLVQSMKFADLAILYGENNTEADEFISHIPVPTSKEILKVQMGPTILSYAGPNIIAACGILTPDSPPVTPLMLQAV